MRNVFILATAAWTAYDIYLATENIVSPWPIVATLLCFLAALAFQYLINHRDNETTEVYEKLAAFNPRPGYSDLE